MTDAVQAAEAQAPEAAMESEAPSAAESLLAAKTKTEEPVSEQAETTDEVQEVQLLANKFKTAEELEKGYIEQQKLLREKGKLAPESYELSLPEGMTVADDDPLLGQFSELAKKHNLSNEAYNEFIAMKLQSDASMATDLDAERAKLGDNADEILANVGNFYRSKLSAEGFAAVQGLAATADGVMALDALRKELQPTQPVSPRATTASKPSVTQADAEAQLAKATQLHQAGKIEEAAVARAKATKMFEQLHPAR